MVWNKKIFKLFYFSFQLPAHLVDFLDKILPILSATEDTEKYQIIIVFRHGFTQRGLGLRPWPQPNS